MKKSFKLLFISFLFVAAACKSSKNSTRNDEKDLGMLIKRLEKRGADEKIMTDIKNVYTGAYQKGTERIANYQYDPAPQKWDKILAEMEGLQRMYETISRNAYVLRQVKPENYYQQIRTIKDTAASDYYTYATKNANRENRSDLKEAYNAFRKANEYIPNYKDSKDQMQRVFEKATVEVLVNPVQYDAFGVNRWNWNSYNNRSQMQNEQMVRDLGGSYTKTIPARFYSERDLRRQNLTPDLVVDLLWRNMRFDQPNDRTRSYNRSKQIETGKDTANRPVYQTVTATVFVTERQLNADADLQIMIVNTVTRQQVKWEQVPSSYRYSFEFADFNGDRRALQSEDWNLINRSRNQAFPSQEEAMDEMMRRIYNDVLNRIRRSVDW
jgi:hypothetical protein